MTDTDLDSALRRLAASAAVVLRLGGKNPDAVRRFVAETVCWAVSVELPDEPETVARLDEVVRSGSRRRLTT